MFSRLQQFPKRSFFLFGPRGTGKSTLLKKRFSEHHCLWLDLLESEIEERFLRNPSELYAIVQALPKETTHVLIDEIQKVPRLLDEVHRLIEESDKIFILEPIQYKIVRLDCAKIPGLDDLKRRSYCIVWHLLTSSNRGIFALAQTYYFILYRL